MDIERFWGIKTWDWVILTHGNGTRIRFSGWKSRSADNVFQLLDLGLCSFAISYFSVVRYSFVRYFFVSLRNMCHDQLPWSSAYRFVLERWPSSSLAAISQRRCSVSRRSSKGFLFDYQHCWFSWLLSYVVFGRIWQHGKYSCGVWSRFAYNSENFQNWPQIEKCEQFSNGRIRTQTGETK